MAGYRWLRCRCYYIYRVVTVAQFPGLRTLLVLTLRLLYRLDLDFVDLGVVADVTGPVPTHFEPRVAFTPLPLPQPTAVRPLPRLRSVAHDVAVIGASNHGWMITLLPAPLIYVTTLPR